MGIGQNASATETFLLRAMVYFQTQIAIKHKVGANTHGFESKINKYTIKT